MAKQIKLSEDWGMSDFGSNQKDPWEERKRKEQWFESEIQRALTAKAWEVSGKSFFEFAKIGDPIDLFLVDDLTFSFEELRSCISVNILAYHHGERGLEPLKASFKAIGRPEPKYLEGYIAENGKLFTTNRDLISPKEARESGLLTEEDIRKLESTGHDEHHPIMTLKNWENLQKRNHGMGFIYRVQIGWQFSTDFVAFFSGQSNPSGEAVGKEDEGCVPSEEKDEFVAVRPLFKELYPGEWKLVGYTANGKLYSNDEDVRELGAINAKPSEMKRDYERTLKEQEERRARKKEWEKEERKQEREEALQQLKAIKTRNAAYGNGIVIDSKDVVTYPDWKETGLAFANYVRIGQEVSLHMVQSLVDGYVKFESVVTSAFPLAYYKKAISRVPESGPLYARFKKEIYNVWKFEGYENEYAFVSDENLLITPDRIRNEEKSIVDNWIAALNKAYDGLSFESEELHQLINQDWDKFDGDISKFIPGVMDIDKALKVVVSSPSHLEKFGKLEEMTKAMEEAAKAMEEAHQRETNSEKDSKELKVKKILDSIENGKEFFESVKIGDIVNSKFVRNITHMAITKQCRFYCSANILAYWDSEYGVIPVYATFELNPFNGGLKFIAYATIGKAFMKPTDKLVSPKEAMETGLLAEEDIEKLKSFGSDELNPIVTLEGWGRLIKSYFMYESLSFHFCDMVEIGWHFSTDLVAKFSGQKNPSGEIISKEDTGCIDNGDGGYVGCKAVFRELNPIEWELVGYTANGRMYSEGEIKSLKYLYGNDYNEELERYVEEKEEKSLSDFLLSYLNTYKDWKRSGLAFASNVMIGQKVDEKMVQSLVDGSLTSDVAVSTFPLAYYKKALSRVPESGPLHAKFKKESGEWRLVGYENEYAFVSDDESLNPSDMIWNEDSDIIDNWITALNKAYDGLSFKSEELYQLINQKYSNFRGDISAFIPKTSKGRKVNPRKAGSNSEKIDNDSGELKTISAFM